MFLPSEFKWEEAKIDKVWGCLQEWELDGLDVYLGRRIVDLNPTPIYAYDLEIIKANSSILHIKKQK